MLKCDHIGTSSNFLVSETILGLISKKCDVSVIFWCHLLKLWSKKKPMTPVFYNFLSNSFGLLSRLFLNVCVFPSRPWKQIAEQWALLRCDSAMLSSFFLIFFIYQLLSRYKRPNSSWFLGSYTRLLQTSQRGLSVLCLKGKCIFNIFYCCHGL